MMLLLRLLELAVVWTPLHVGWTWLRPMRKCHGRCKGKGVFRASWGQGVALCADCGGNGSEPKPMHTFLYERVGLFKHPAHQTGIGHRRGRARKARQRSAGRKVIR